MSTFDGETYVEALDYERLSKQLDRVRAVMDNATGWLTLGEISDLTHDPEASISARLRDLRKAKFGARTIDARRRGLAEDGLWEYWMHNKLCACSACLGPGPEAKPSQAEQIEELLNMRDYLLNELSILLDAERGTEDWEATCRAVDRVDERIWECSNGWVGPAWEWPSRRQA